VTAGLAQSPDYDAFIATYLDASRPYRSLLDAYLARRGIDAGGDAVGVFSALPEQEKRVLIEDIFFNELLAGGSTGVATGDYSRGFDAISTLFTDHAGAGDITTPVSVIKTVDGGSIALSAPYGSINAGATFRAIEKPSDELGVITGRGGDIGIFVDGDLQVNRERVIALQSDLLVWSSNGSIDAGKGAKSIVSVPDPIVTFDANGNVVVIFPPAVEGSGLSAVNGYLFAPRGAINAGDAGIRASGNLTVGAVEVIGADNIDVGGVSVGVPATTNSVDVNVADAGALASSATSLAEDTTSSLGSEDAEAETALGILSVQVMGFGDCPQDQPDCGKE
jgi:filamentous hemagglutinin